VKNQDKMPWKKLVSVLSSYLDSTRILFERSEVLINPERRIQGVRIDDKTIRKVPPPQCFDLTIGDRGVATRRRILNAAVYTLGMCILELGVSWSRVCFQEDIMGMLIYITSII
jgi:hypothetical protein